MSHEAEPLPRVLPYTLVGLHFGVLQTALFFAAQIFVTATFVGYFAVVVAWMVGVIANLWWQKPGSLRGALVTSTAAWFVALLAAHQLGAWPPAIPLYLALGAVVALPAGAFFRENAPKASGRSLFLHENNGFVLGMVLGTVSFLHWGIGFLLFGPLLTGAIALLASAGFATEGALLVAGATVACALVDATLPLYVLAATCGAMALTAPIRATAPDVHHASTGPRPSLNASRAMLTLAGFNLILLQYFITREFSTILAATELTILVVGIAYFSGYSVGYAVSRVIPMPVLQGAAVGMFALHLAMLTLAKVVGGQLVQAQYGVAVLVGLLFLTSFACSALYSVLLPRLMSEEPDLGLVEAYSWDLGGAVLGTAAVFALTLSFPASLWPLYFGAMVALVVLLLRSTAWWRGALLAGSIAWVWLVVHQDTLHTLATEDYYRTRGYDNAQVVFSGNSFYHSMDVISSTTRPHGDVPDEKSSFLNGVRYFRYYYESGAPSDESKLSEYTYYLAELPAAFLSRQRGGPIRVLVMGAGSMYSVKRVEPYSTLTTVVEIDRMVTDTAHDYWSEINHLDEVANYEVVIDDVAHYLSTTDQRFDLIVNDISAPYYLGTTLCHSKDFYELVRARLAPGGVFAESTQGFPDAKDYDDSQLRILRGVADVFPVWRVLTTSGNLRRGNQGYIYATDSFPLETDLIKEEAKAAQMYDGTKIYWEGTSHFRLHRTEPYSLNNMDALLTNNWYRLEGRLGLDQKRPKRVPLGEVLSRSFDPESRYHSALLLWLRDGLLSLKAAVMLVALAAGVGLTRKLE